MASYTQVSGPDGKVLAGQVRRDDGADIFAGDGPDWQAYLAWGADGNVPAAAPAAPSAPPTVTGNQWAFALGDLGLAAAWRAGVAKSKDKDQIRWSLIARDTPLLATDPLLIRIAANAGQGADGSAMVDPAKVFARALTEPT